MGNSSAGIREAGIYGIPAIDIGTRQNGRYRLATSKNIIHIVEDKTSIEEAIHDIKSYAVESYLFGDGNSTMRFFEVMRKTEFWKTKIQKHFVDFQM